MTREGLLGAPVRVEDLRILGDIGHLLVSVSLYGIVVVRLEGGMFKAKLGYLGEEKRVKFWLFSKLRRSSGDGWVEPMRTKSLASICKVERAYDGCA